LVEEGENSLAALAQFAGINDLRENIKYRWIHHIHNKVTSVLRFCAMHHVNLVVFPEYSIPLEVLQVCREIADEGTMVIVAGSHTIANESQAAKLYKELGLETLNLSLADPDSDIRKSVCPIFVPKSAPQTVEKVTKSVWETDMKPGRPLCTLEIEMGGAKFRLGVLLCIDALRLEQLSSLFRSDQEADLLAIPSFSKNTAPFDFVSSLSMMNEVPCLYANGALGGGSKIFARAGSATHSWPTQSDGTEKIPEGEEAVAVVDVDFDEQAETRRTVRSHCGMRVIAYAPLLFTGHSDLCRDFAKRRDHYIDSRSRQLGSEAREHLSMLARADTALFPALLRSKIQRLIDFVSIGSLRVEDIRFFLETVDLPLELCSTPVLRQVLIKTAVNAVTSLIHMPGSVSEQERIFKVVKNITKHRTELPPGLLESGVASLGQSDTPTPTVVGRASEAEPSSFFDRQQELDDVRSFVNNPRQRMLIVEGMKGIGKTFAVRRIFVEVLPRWRCVWISLAEGAAFDQLIAGLASKIGLPAGDLPSQAEADQLASAVLTRVDYLEATGIVLAGCQHLLSPDGNFTEDRSRDFLVRLGSAPSRRNAKVFLISDSRLPLTRTEETATRARQFRGLEDRHARNLFEYWLRIERAESRGEPVEIPEKLTSFLRGHPLAIVIAAKLCGDRSPDQLVNDLSIFKKLRKEIVDVLLNKIILQTAQKSLIEFASVFRSGIPIEVFRQWGGDAALLALNSIVARFLLELFDQQYWMHPAVAHYFYEHASPERRHKYHELAGSFYRSAYEKSEPKDPTLIVEAIYHIAASGDIESARRLGIHKEQLKALARHAYNRRDWEASLTFFEAISRIDRNDEYAQAHMALCLGRLARWIDADKHFKRAIQLKPRCRTFQAYGAIKVMAGLLTEGEAHLYQALELDDRDSATLTSLAILRIAQGRRDEAEKLFQEALEANPENWYTLFSYARFLRDEGRGGEAKPHAELAMELDPLNQRVRELIKSLQADEEQGRKRQAGTG
jgi:tetratricopeptide (TPR) repeat protein/predicted amidohydrolase